METILVCDDERDIVAALRIYLKEYRVLEAYTGKEALEILRREEVQLVLLDVMMPEMDGITALAQLREHSNVPVILLTAKSEDADKILGLDVGADDYITKPFSPAEVQARVRSHLRRYLRLGSRTEQPTSYRCGGVELDDAAKSVTVDGEPVQLTPKEYDILLLLMQNAGKVFSTAEIYRQVWNEEPFQADRTVAVHIRHLREKLELNPAEPRWLKVVWGKGYKMEDNGR